ncbi:MAG: exodeoxyribonuclease VII small subunit [Rubritalea sp.]|uniref:exodeoxyribonuclease VII small subunit n=1 Tax=Rubritalea sp. TaxID=2109375 RepID=UPI0032425581
MPKKSAPSFEEAIEELDKLVDQMESDQLPLEELISHYERGAKLLSECESTLTSAKKRLETIKNSDTKVTTKAAPKPSNNSPSSDNDEIRLF